jgi:tetratricopeptide (TPR) repeat protein
MENDYIKLSIFPEIGGKIWGAIEKSTGNEFIYYNSVVKFRDIAMRGAWTSGGIELNFGIIGHAPTSAAPVDYLTRKNEDGSVSCFVSATDFLTRTRWETEINLQKDKAFFTTTTKWHNPTPLVQPYYQWMNAAYQVNGDLEFCFPADHWIGHDGRAHSWPIDPEGRDISWYRNNNFGGSKSNHVLGGISDHYAGYWHDLEFGSGHYSEYGEKLGMKVFQWAHSRSGGIWEDLLTDTDGQYVELQSGRLFNQAASNSAFTPFKHFGFEPYGMDVFREYWFPILQTKGVKKANPTGVLNVEKEGDLQIIYFCPLQNIDEDINVYFGENLKEQIHVTLDALQTWSKKLSANTLNEPLKIVVGEDMLVYSEKQEDNFTNRPMESPADFDWNSAYGLFLEGQQLMYQNKFLLAEKSFLKCLEKDPYYAPALNQMVALSYRKADYENGLSYASTSLSINTYDPEANFIYGLIHKKMNNLLDAQDGFSVATLTPSFRNAANLELAKLFLLKGDIISAGTYAKKVIEHNPDDLEGNRLMMVINRKIGRKDKALAYGNKINEIIQLDHIVDYERWLLEGTTSLKNKFMSAIKCELTEQTYLELAQWYEDLGSYEEAIELLELSPANAMVHLKLAYLNHQINNSTQSNLYLEKSIELSPEFIFPFRHENLAMLGWTVQNSDTWKPKFYLGLLQWKFGNIDEARELFSKCGNEPDFASFYLTKVELFREQEGYYPEPDLIMANELAPDQWRTFSYLIDYYLSKNQSNEALVVASEAIKKFPDNNLLKYSYATCLMADGQYSACKEALAKTVILPSEGARYGRLTYRQACLMESIENFEQKKYNEAIKSLYSARLWPENLGVGKPFNVDERIENFFEATCLAKKGKKRQAEQLFQNVVTYGDEHRRRHGSVDYLYLMSLRYLGEESRINSHLNEWASQARDDPMQQWCNAMMDGDSGKANIIAGQINTESGGTPWDPAYADPEFEIIKSIAKAIQ